MEDQPPAGDQPQDPPLSAKNAQDEAEDYVEEGPDPGETHVFEDSLDGTILPHNGFTPIPLMKPNINTHLPGPAHNLFTTGIYSFRSNSADPSTGLVSNRVVLMGIDWPYNKSSMFYEAMVWQAAAKAGIINDIADVVVPVAKRNATHPATYCYVSMHSSAAAWRLLRYQVQLELPVKSAGMQSVLSSPVVMKFPGNQQELDSGELPPMLKVHSPAFVGKTVLQVTSMLLWYGREMYDSYILSEDEDEKGAIASLLQDLQFIPHKVIKATEQDYALLVLGIRAAPQRLITGYHLDHTVPGRVVIETSQADEDAPGHDVYMTFTRWNKHPLPAPHQVWVDAQNVCKWLGHHTMRDCDPDELKAREQTCPTEAEVHRMQTTLETALGEPLPCELCPPVQLDTLITGSGNTRTTLTITLPSKAAADKMISTGYFELGGGTEIKVKVPKFSANEYPDYVEPEVVQDPNANMKDAGYRAGVLSGRFEEPQQEAWGEDSRPAKQARHWEPGSGRGFHKGYGWHHPGGRPRRGRGGRRA